jgi:hypothetical protein
MDPALQSKFQRTLYVVCYLNRGKREPKVRRTEGSMNLRFEGIKPDIRIKTVYMKRICEQLRLNFFDISAIRAIVFGILFFFTCFNICSEELWASADINVRTGPGTSYDVMGQLYQNEKVEIFDIIDGWAQILFDGVEGYVKADLLLQERILTAEEEEEAARIVAEQERQRLEQEQKRARFRHVVKTILFAIVGIIGFIVIVFLL